MREKISGKTFDAERSLYHLVGADVENCIFGGPADGESVLKESRDITVSDCSFTLRYPFWHVRGFAIQNCDFGENARASLWYGENGSVENCHINAIKMLRECRDVSFSGCDITSLEFGWKCDGIRIENSKITSEYIFFDSNNVNIRNLEMKGKYSFQYMKNLVIEDSYLDTKDAFWHSENVVVRNSVVKGEYLGWFSDGLTLINCKIIGTQPLCYCKNLTLVNCTMEGCDLSFEYSDVDATVIGHIDSVKNPRSGKITADSVGEIIREDPAMECSGEVFLRTQNERNQTMKSKVYFTREITPEAVLKLYRLLGVTLPGKVAIKLHSGEVGNQNFLRPDFFKPIIDAVQGTVVECNTAYAGKRNTTEKHLETLKEHGWSEYYPVDLLDAEGEDIVLDIPNGTTIKKNYIGNHADRYDSMLVLSHFKGHPMGGYGGALKQLSIGVASSFGKAYIHGAGEPEKIWTADHDSFLRSMADAAGSVIEFYKNQLAYVNVMKNLSVDCDCCAVAEDPCMKDIGILVSLDPVALDKACLDLVYASDDPGRDHLIKRIESRNGALTVDAAAALGYGSKEYELIEV